MGRKLSRRIFAASGLAFAANPYGKSLAAETDARQAPPPGTVYRQGANRDTGIREVVLSTYDIDRIARPLIDVGRYKLFSLPDASRAQYAAWHVPDACTRIEQGLLVPPSLSSGNGALRLVKFHDVEQRVMRSSQRSWDTGGIFDVDVLARDVDAIYRRLQSHGWTGLGEPVDNAEAGYRARIVVAVGPDGFVLTMMERFTPPIEGRPDGETISPIFNSTQMVADFDRAVDFYTKTLGWGTRSQFRVDDAIEPGADVLGLPLPFARTARRRIGMYHPAQTPNASVELIENKSMQGRDFSAFCVAPNVGILCLRIPVPNATVYAKEIAARGGDLYAPPRKFEIAPYGDLTIFSIRSPEGAILEFFDNGR